MGSLAEAGAPPSSAVWLQEHRVALTGHCYRMLGSVAEADDAVQETLLRAWRSLSGFDGRSSLRTWLYRIATNVCLDALAERKRRQRPVLCREVGRIDEELTALPASSWIEPIPDLQAVPTDVDPAQRAVLRQTIRLAFVAALQHLPPRQRAVLLLADVLDLSAAEIAESLEMSVAAVNSALQRARATMASRDISPSQPPPTLSPTEEDLVSRYVQAFERYDMDALLRLLHDEVTLSMPPYTLWLQGHDSVRAWMLGRGAGCRGSRLLPTEACGLPAFGQYRLADPGPGYQAWSLIVLELDSRGTRIAALNHFLDTASLFPRFGLPLTLDESGA